MITDPGIVRSFVQSLRTLINCEGHRDEYLG